MSFFTAVLTKLEKELSIISSLEQKSSGTMFLTYKTDTIANSFYKRLNELKQEKCPFWVKTLKINQWEISKAPSKATLIWENI